MKGGIGSTQNIIVNKHRIINQRGPQHSDIIQKKNMTIVNKSRSQIPAKESGTQSTVEYPRQSNDTEQS